MNRQAVISLESPLAGRFVNDIPEPTNDVAVTTPTALIPPARTLIPVRAVISPTESILVTSSYVRTPVNVAATPVMFLTAMSGVPVNPVAFPVRLQTNPLTAVMIPLVASSVIAVPTLTTLLNVEAVPVIILLVDATPVSPVPSPKKLVALTTPTIFNFSTGDVELTPTLLSVSTVKVDGLLNFDKLRARVISQLLSSYLGHKKDHLVYCLVVWKFGEKVK